VTTNEIFVDALKSSFEMFKMTLADMSDADLMTRPVPNANHGNWQLGHLIVSEVWFVGSCGGKVPELPAGFKEKYSEKGTNASDDPAKFAKKAEMLAIFEKVRQATIEWVRTLPASEWAAKGPMDLVPTKASVINLASVHMAMHLGQIQVLRRKLGKPILF
jgi:DinB superfamily